MLAPPQPGQAGRGPELPGRGVLPARQIERAEEARLGVRHGARPVLQQDELAPDAQQLRGAPALLVALRPRQRIVAPAQSRRRVAGPARRLRQLGPERGVAWREPGLPEGLQPGLQTGIEEY